MKKASVCPSSCLPSVFEGKKTLFLRNSVRLTTQTTRPTHAGQRKRTVPTHAGQHKHTVPTHAGRRVGRRIDSFSTDYNADGNGDHADVIPDYFLIEKLFLFTRFPILMGYFGGKCN